MSSRSALLAVAAAAACVASAGSAAGAIPSAKLALMPLPQASFGREAVALQLDADQSGVIDDAEAAFNSNDPKDTAASLRSAGRITGFGVSFGSVALLLKAGHLVYASSGVDLYRDGRSASAGLVRDLLDATDDDPTAGFKVLASSRFAAPGLRDEAAGIRIKARFGSITLWLTGVEVRRGDLIEGIIVMRTDARSEDAAALDLARALSARVEDVLAGKVTTPPAKLAATKPTSKSAVKPKVEIASAALTSADLDGAKITRQEYVADDNAVSAYERAFASVTYGTTRLSNLESDVRLMQSAAQASIALEAVRVTLDPKSGSLKKLLVAEFAKTSGLGLKSFSVVRERSLTLPGARGYEVVVHLTTAFARFDLAYVFIGSGRFFGSLFMTSSPGAAIASADVARISRAFAGRMRTGALHLTPVA